MRKTLIAALAALAIAPAAQAADLAATTASLRDKALADRTAWDVTESLTTEVGPRPQGSPGMDRARDWGVAKLKALGFQNVHVEPFETESWLRGPESAEVVAPFPQKLQIVGLGRSASTPPGGLEAEIALFKTLDEMLALPAGALKGKIAVVVEPMRRTQDIGGYGAAVRARGAGAEAAKRGAVAYLVRSISTDDTRLPHGGSGARGAGVPMAALSPPDAELLERMVARGGPVRVRLAMQSTYREKAPAYNVVGEIPGRERPDEVVVIGGHLDAWDLGTGAIDDAAGVGVTVAAAKLAGALAPRRTIRVVMWGAEELGGGSGAAYADAHRQAVANIVLAGESDLGAGEIVKAKLPAGSIGHPAMQAFIAAVRPLKVLISPEPARDGGSDVAGLKALGAPVVEFQQDATRYFDLHHSADDTLDKIDLQELAQNVAVWTAFVYAVADSDIDFRKTASAAQ